MSRPCLIDTNVIIRHLVGDNPEHANAVEKLLTISNRDEMTLILLPAVLSECVFVLESFYDYPPPRIADALRQFVQSHDVELADADIHLDALTRYAAGKLHFVDCTLAAYAKAQGRLLVKFDAGIGRTADVQILNPRSL